MLEKLVALSFATADNQADADGIALMTLPTGIGFTIVGVGFAGVKSAGSNAASVDINDDGSGITGFTTLEIAAAGDQTTFSNYVAGTAPQHIAAASVLTWDLHLTTENITGLLTIFGYWDEA
jgi:hypothetical protein